MSTTWSISRTTAPKLLPATVAQAKAKLRLAIGSTVHDDELTRQIASATEQFEQETDRAVITQAFTLYRDFFPSSGVIELSVKPVQSVQSITYQDSEGGSQTVDPSLYIFDPTRREIVGTWPSTDGTRNNVQVNFTAGYGNPVDVPSVIVECILCLVAALFYGNSPDAEPYRDAYNHLVTNKLRTSYH